MKINRLIICFSILLASVFIGIYVFAHTALPAILNSSYMLNKYESYISAKAGFPIHISGFKYKTNSNLSFTVVVKSVCSSKDEIKLDNIFYQSKILSIKPKRIDADNVFIDYVLAKNLFYNKDKNKNSDIDIKNLSIPLINVQNLYLKLDESYIKITNIKSWKESFSLFCTFDGELGSKYLSEPIYIGRDGKIRYSNKLWFDNLSVNILGSQIFLNGNINKLKITGSNIPVENLKDVFLYYYKLSHKNKKNFIENFANFTGLVDIYLSFSRDGINGHCVTKDLGANFSQYSIPVFLPKVDFIFAGKNIKARAKGTFGGELLYTDVNIKGVATNNLRTNGHVRAKLTDQFTQKYFKPVQIVGGVNASVEYNVKPNDIKIDYSADIYKGSNIILKYGKLDMLQKDRKIIAQTIKRDDQIVLNKYSYLISDNNQKEEVFSGNGLFEKVQSHYKPIRLSVKTNGDIPVTYVKSFIEDYLEGGMFNADLEYNFLKKSLVGNLTLKDVQRNDFLYLSYVTINIVDNLIKITSEGKFFEQPIKFILDANNNFQNGLVINNVDIILQKFYLRRGYISSVKTEIDAKKAKYSKPHKKRTSDYKIEVKNGHIYVGEIIHSRFYLHDVSIFGMLKNNIVDFIIPQTEYAQGILSAVGTYDVVNHSTDINFLASDIDSNEVATNFFKLPNQFEGRAYAVLHMISKNKLNDIHAESTFAISDGFLPKLGSREFVLNRPNKFKKVLFFINKPIKFTLSKICNIDFTKPNVFYSNLRGSFMLDDDKVSGVKIFSESDNLSMFIEGVYDIDNQIGNLVVWGRHNKIAGKKIKILNIPLSLIYRLIFRVEKSMDMYADKVKQIPPINALPHEESVFRVNVEGDLNSNDIKLNFKDIRNKIKK